MAESNSPRRGVWAVFFLSGFASLCYEVVFTKQLGYVFGTTAHAVSTVLAAFMAGLAAGSYAGGRWSLRLKDPVRAYGWAELGVGVYGLLTPFLFAGLTAAYARVGATLVSGGAGLAILTATRFALAMIIILPPTFLMGATFPILSRRFAADPVLGQRVTQLYTVNTLGAAVGALLSTYLLLASLGISGSLAVAASGNAVIFLWTRLRAERFAPAPPGTPSPAGASGASRRSGADWAVYLLALFSGFLTLSFEVVWSHVLALLVGTSVYAFGTVLFTFLVGLTAGGALVARFVARAGRAATLRWLVFLLVATSFSVLWTLSYWEGVPTIFDAVGQLHPSFALGELTRSTTSFLLIIVPTLFMGMLFPAGLALLGDAGEAVGRQVGIAYVWNTAGTIMGSVLTGFVLVAWLGSENTIRWLAVMPLPVAVLLLAWDRRWLDRVLVPAAALGCAALAVLGTRWDVARMSDGSNVYFRPSFDVEKYQVDFLHEDLHSGFTMVIDDGWVRTLVTNGKFEGNDGPEKLDQAFVGLVPGLYLPDRNRALVIGLGTGQTLAVIEALGFGKVDIVDTSEGIIRAAREQFGALNNHVLEKPHVSLIHQDGRNHLLLNRQPYDVIAIQLTSVWFANAANLYSQEFYRLCARNLSERGVLQQWVQFHHITLEDIATIVETARSVFPNAELWLGGHQGVLIASRAPLQPEPARRWQSPTSGRSSRRPG
jgi:spermidine synthase